MFNYIKKSMPQVFTLLIILILCLLSLILTLFLVNNRSCGFISKNGTNDISSDSRKLKIVTRLEWLAKPSLQTLSLDTPVPYVIIHHTATENCSFLAQCIQKIRLIQTFHMESRGWYDIGYNFLIGGDGLVYEGRGWKKQGAHTYKYNEKSIGIGFIGDFNTLIPIEKQLETCKYFIQEGVRLGYIQNAHKLFGARQLMNTNSQGRSQIEMLEQAKKLTVQETQRQKYTNSKYILFIEYIKMMFILKLLNNKFFSEYY